jgi:exosortase A
MDMNKNLSTTIQQIKPVVWLTLLLCSFGIMTFPAWKQLVAAWYGSEENSHGFFIIPICLYLVWNKKETLTNIQINSSIWGLGWFVFAVLLYVFAFLGAIKTVTAFSIVLMISGGVVYLYGFSIFREIRFPLIFLLFMIPVPAQIYSALTIPLQLFVSSISVDLSGIFGIPIYREGNVIHLPENTLQVVEACSGMRSMISLLTLSAIFSYLTLKSHVLRWVLFVAGIPVAIFVNIIRVIIMIFAFYYWGYDLTTDPVHTYFGLAIFGVALIVLFITKELLTTWEK